MWWGHSLPLWNDSHILTYFTVTYFDHINHVGTVQRVNFLGESTVLVFPEALRVVFFSSVPVLEKIGEKHRKTNFFAVLATLQDPDSGSGQPILLVSVQAHLPVFIPKTFFLSFFLSKWKKKISNARNESTWSSAPCAPRRPAGSQCFWALLLLGCTAMRRLRTRAPPPASYKP